MGWSAVCCFPQSPNLGGVENPMIKRDYYVGASFYYFHFHYHPCSALLITDRWEALTERTDSMCCQTAGYHWSSFWWERATPRQTLSRGLSTWNQRTTSHEVVTWNTAVYADQVSTRQDLQHRTRCSDLSGRCKETETGEENGSNSFRFGCVDF